MLNGRTKKYIFTCEPLKDPSRSLSYLPILSFSFNFFQLIPPLSPYLILYLLSSPPRNALTYALVFRSLVRFSFLKNVEAL
jgi:hypothetical protein